MDAEGQTGETRRGFLTVLSLAVPLWMAYPTLIGNPAGGVYVPVPRDISGHVKWHAPVHPVAQAITVQQVTSYASVRVVGQAQAHLVSFVGSVVLARSPHLHDAQRVNGLRSLRDCMDTSHEPGWFKVPVERWNGDEDDDASMVTGHMWKRIDHVEWMPYPSEGVRVA